MRIGMYINTIRVTWVPLDDITTYELAIVLPNITSDCMFIDINKFITYPENVRRHFEVNESDLAHYNAAIIRNKLNDFLDENK